MNPLKIIPCILAVLVVSARADYISPGYKPIEHVVVFTNLYTFTNYYFVIYPRDSQSGISSNPSMGEQAGFVVLNALSPSTLRQNRGVYLFAIPKALYARTGYPLEEWFTNKVPGVLKSPRLVDAIRALPISDPRQKIVNRYRIEGLPDKLDLIPVDSPAPSPGETKPLKKSEASTLFSLSCAAAVWITIAQFRRRPTPVASAKPYNPRISTR
jgi:hypothetical protein